MAIQAATAAMMVNREVDAGPISYANIASTGEVCRQKYGGPALKQLSFNWNAPDKYVELQSFKMEDTNILQTNMYILTEEDDFPIIKNW